MGILFFIEYAGTIPPMFTDVARLLNSPARLKLLKFFVLQSQSRATATIAATVVGVSKEVAKNEINALFRAKVLISKRQGRETSFSVNTAHPLFETLAQFLSVATLPANIEIAKVFSKVRGLVLLVATGVLALEDKSAIDILLITKKPNDSHIAPAVRQLEHLVALPIRYTVLEPTEYHERLEAYDRLLRDVFEYSHRIVLDRR